MTILTSRIIVRLSWCSCTSSSFLSPVMMIYLDACTRCASHLHLCGKFFCTILSLWSHSRKCLSFMDDGANCRNCKEAQRAFLQWNHCGDGVQVERSFDAVVDFYKYAAGHRFFLTLLQIRGFLSKRMALNVIPKSLSTGSELLMQMETVECLWQLLFSMPLVLATRKVDYLLSKNDRCRWKPLPCGDQS